MSDAPQDLQALQDWMQRSITDPHGIYGSTSDAEIAAHIGASDRQTSQQRLAIYHQAYFARLLEVLREMFPVLLEMLEQQTFDALALAYLEQHPPQSYSLNRLADRFVGFLQKTRPPRAGAAPDWADFMIDLARMETAIEAVFDGPGNEAQPPLDSFFVSQLQADQAAELRLELAPCVRLLAFSFPLNDYFTAARRGEAPPLPPPEATWLALYRRDYIVRRLPLSEPEYAILAALAAGKPLGAAIAEAVSLVDSPDFPLQLQTWFRNWAAAGLFSRAA